MLKKDKLEGHHITKKNMKYKHTHPKQQTNKRKARDF